MTSENFSDNFIYFDHEAWNMPDSKQSDKYKIIVQKWLSEDNYRIEDKPDLKAQFHLSATRNGQKWV